MSTPTRRMSPPPHQPEMSWNPDHLAVVVEPARGAPHVSLIRHDSYPYEVEWNEAATGWNGLFDIANDYLARVNKWLKLQQSWLDDLKKPQPEAERMPNAPLHWLRDQRDPRHSYWVERRLGLDAPSRPKGDVVDRAAVLLAGLWFPGAKVGPTTLPSRPLYGGQGLRIVVQAGLSQAGRTTVRIGGVTSTLPLPGIARLSVEMLHELPQRIASAFGLSRRDVIVDGGLWLPGADDQEELPFVVAKTAPAPARDKSSSDKYPGDDYAHDPISYLLVMRANPDAPNGIEPLIKRPLIAFADAKVFVQDPISRNGAAAFTTLRPSRSWTVLDPERVSVQFGNLPAGAGGNVKLIDPDPNTPPDPDFRVTNCPLVDGGLSATAPKEVPQSVNVHVRTNTFAAVNAFSNTRQLFDRMRSYGLSPASYFRFVTRPIDVLYRAGIIPGAGDGRTVNAQVRWTLQPVVPPAGSSAESELASIAPGTIEVRFALGDLESSVGQSPLGLASDPRWCWHEYCHVLLTAAVGELELRFAHSAGDALAAILCDPASRLAHDVAGTGSAINGPWRGVTFPWVFIPRRHDRDVRDGWSWIGPLDQREVDFPVPGLSDKRGYWVEQILSSSLFRLYRAIGGDSQIVGGDPQASFPGRAADYAAYLVMRTIGSIGAAGAASCKTASDFVDAMVKVDTATATVPGPGGYVGGAVNKVIRWAFERQGLNGMPVAGLQVSGPDESATVDLHIEDRRAKPEGPYSPVDLLGQDWQADPNSLWVKDPFLWWPRRIHVKVRNRGADPAPNTRVDVWYAPVNGTIPPYPDARWQLIDSETRNVPARSNGTPGVRKFGPFAWTPPASPRPQDYAILAAASCDADLSNLAAGYPCATVAGPIEVLVACDNNLGLITVTLT